MENYYFQQENFEMLYNLIRNNFKKKHHFDINSQTNIRKILIDIFNKNYRNRPTNLPNNIKQQIHILNKNFLLTAVDTIKSSYMKDDFQSKNLVNFHPDMHKNMEQKRVQIQEYPQAERGQRRAVEMPKMSRGNNIQKENDAQFEKRYAILEAERAKHFKPRQMPKTALTYKPIIDDDEGNLVRPKNNQMPVDEITDEVISKEESVNRMEQLIKARQEDFNNMSQIPKSNEDNAPAGVSLNSGNVGGNLLENFSNFIDNNSNKLLETNNQLESSIDIQENFKNNELAPVDMQRMIAETDKRRLEEYNKAKLNNSTSRQE